MATDIVIDDSLYSRQRYVLGDSAMQRMARSSVFLYGMGGLGAEIAKNIVLAGVKSLTVQDASIATTWDLGSQFLLREKHVIERSNRAEVSAVSLSELNPYVRINALTSALDETTDLTYLTQFQCVILTELPMKTLLTVNKFCRSQSPPIMFIHGDVYGVFCTTFCDFGDEFTVLDPNGEEPREIFIANITRENPGVVTCLENRMHGFETGDMVTFREVNGMTELNGKTTCIKVVSPYVFSICDTSSPQFSPYQHGGVAVQIKTPLLMKFDSLEKQILSPDLLTPDLGKLEVPANIHLGYLALHEFREKYARLPNIRCLADATQLKHIVAHINERSSEPISEVREDLIELMSFICRGCLPPLCTTLGGIIAHETLKSLSGKFTPLRQWFHLDASELVSHDQPETDFRPKGDRYDQLRVCIGDELLRKLMSLKIFMVGCGAIGCEMLKNYALLGIGTEANGKITITDNDLIEKSNLNRQFLFRPHHIRQPKSTTAAQSVLDINGDLHIDARQHKVCPQTESSVFTDSFFEQHDVIVNALDNVEARRYMDSRCVTNQRPLLESGTMGAKGHIQVIVPHLTECYASQQDPPDEDVPYCTLKSFPAKIEHCIEWARDKFESSFTMKPNLVNNFWSKNSTPQAVIQSLREGVYIENICQMCKVVQHRPTSWDQCILQARLKFEKYFNHKAKHLLHAFPLDSKLNDGSLFWQSPKRPPVPQVFDINNTLHVQFVVSTARLYAAIANITVPSEDEQPGRVASVLHSALVPDWRPHNKRIETEESAVKAQPDETSSGDELLDTANILQGVIHKGHIRSMQDRMTAASFEKDDDSNSHIDFITAASNLRASMYSLELADRLKTKKIAGRIVPAIATTTAAVSGLVTIELIKLVKQCPLEHYKNGFLNLALPLLVLSEPGAVGRTCMRDDLSFSLWDKWHVYGDKDFTLAQFIHYFKEKYGFDTSVVVCGVKMIYVPMMPGHKKRLPQTMVKLLRPAPGQLYAELIVSFSGQDDDDIPGPPVRYYFQSPTPA